MKIKLKKFFVKFSKKNTINFYEKMGEDSIFPAFVVK